MVHRDSDYYGNKLHELKRVANQSADMHSAEADRYSRWGEILTSGGLVSSAFLLLLSLASDDFIARTIGLTPDSYKWVIALFSFLTFSSTLVSLAWRPFEKAASHREATSHFSRAKHEIDVVLGSDTKLSQQIVQGVIDNYLESDRLPAIVDRRFNKLKRRHLLKVAVSAALSENPHRSLWRIRKTLAKSATQPPSAT